MSEENGSRKIICIRRRSGRSSLRRSRTHRRRLQCGSVYRRGRRNGAKDAVAGPFGTQSSGDVAAECRQKPLHDYKPYRGEESEGCR